MIRIIKLPLSHRRDCLLIMHMHVCVCFGDIPSMPQPKPLTIDKLMGYVVKEIKYIKNIFLF